MTPERTQIQTELLQAATRLFSAAAAEIPRTVTYKGLDVRDMVWGELIGLVEILITPNREAIRVPAEAEPAILAALEAAPISEMIVLQPAPDVFDIFAYTADPAGVRSGRP